MNTLIVYASKYGCAEKCAMELSKEFDGNVETVNLKENQRIDLDKFDKVIIGGSVYIGKIQKEVTDFINKNLKELLERKIGLFICGMQEGNELEKEIADNFPADLLNRAKSVKHFGGAFDFKKMNFMEKAIVKKIVKVSSDKSDIKHENIKQLAIEMQK
ncbi:MAG TPA: flavodoxin [Tissierellia bacterium]|nr:flavodoxin [Tissierellia bacterium]